MNVTTGQPAPPFTLLDQEGQPWGLEAQRGRPVVLYFYPRDDTSGCTKQACDVRDHWSEFTALGAEVVGISPDDVDSHAAFASKYELPQTLLADPEREVLRAYGAWGTKNLYGKKVEGVIRSSVVVDGDGKVVAVFKRIRPEQQSAKALDVIRELTS